MYDGLNVPERILLGRDVRTQAAAEIAALGRRVALVRSRSVAWADDLTARLSDHGCTVSEVMASGEPDLPGLLSALDEMRPAAPEVVVAVGGGSALDLGKALAALLPAPGDPVRHFEVVGEGLPLAAPPLPFVAVPTTSGTGAEATKNAVIAMPAHRVKVSLRDDRMMARLALVDPALTDDCPRGVTLASGLDAVVQVIEPYLSCKARPETDALCRAAIPEGLAALATLMTGPDPAARDAMARVSLHGGIALANAGLGAVHGLAGVLGGMTGAPHGALCGRLLPGVLVENRAAMAAAGQPLDRVEEVAGWIAATLGGPSSAAFDTLRDRIDAWGLPRLSAMGLRAADHAEVARLSQRASSMKGNPVPLPDSALIRILASA